MVYRILCQLIARALLLLLTTLGFLFGPILNFHPTASQSLRFLCPPHLTQHFIPDISCPDRPLPRRVRHLLSIFSTLLFRILLTTIELLKLPMGSSSSLTLSTSQSLRPASGTALGALGLLSRTILVSFVQSLIPSSFLSVLQF